MMDAASGCFRISFNYKIGYEHPGFWGIIVPLDGEMEVEVGNHRFRLEERDILLMNPETVAFLYSDGVHYIYADIRAEDEELSYSRRMVFDAVHMNKKYALYISMMEILQGFTDFTPSVDFRMGAGERERFSEGMLPLVEESIHQFGEVRAGVKHSRRTAGLLEEVLRELTDPDSGRFHLTEMALRREVSAGYLSKLFFEVVGVKFNDFQSRINLSLAVGILREGTIPLSDIGETVGFTGNKSLNRLFRGMLQCSPSDVRKYFETVHSEKTRSVNIIPDRSRPALESVLEPQENSVNDPVSRFIEIPSPMLADSVRRGNWIDILKSLRLTTARIALFWRGGVFWVRVLDYEVPLTQKTMIELEVAAAAKPELKYVIFQVLYPEAERYPEVGQEGQNTTAYQEAVCDCLSMICASRSQSNIAEWRFEISVPTRAGGNGTVLSSKEVEDYVLEFARNLRDSQTIDRMKVGVHVSGMDLESLNEEGLAAFLGRLKKKVDFCTVDIDFSKWKEAVLLHQLIALRRTLQSMRPREYGEIPFSIANLTLSMDSSTVPPHYLPLYEAYYVMQAKIHLIPFAERVENIQFYDHETGKRNHPMLTDVSGYRRPLYYLFNTMQYWRGNRMLSDYSGVVFRDGGDYYGCLLADPAFSLEVAEHAPENMIYHEAGIHLEGLEGEYKPITERLNPEHGGIPEKEEYPDRRYPVDRELVNFHNAKNRPEMVGQTIKLRGSWSETWKLQAFEFFFFKLIHVRRRRHTPENEK